MKLYDMGWESQDYKLPAFPFSDISESLKGGQSLSVVPSMLFIAMLFKQKEITETFNTCEPCVWYSVHLRRLVAAAELIDQCFAKNYFRRISVILFSCTLS